MQDTVQFSGQCSVLVVIVNYRTSHLVVECLRSLVHEVTSLPGVHVAVVDNASGDDSVARIGGVIESEGWSSWATLIPSHHNGGYAYGNNFAIRPALQSVNPPDYLWLLNPDTLSRPGALAKLVDFLEHHPTIGIAGSSFENQDSSLWPTAFRFPSILGELEGGFRLGIVSKLLKPWSMSRVMTPEEQRVDWIPGASMMIRRQVFESIGLMDEKYFLYYEETDFCLQAKRAGWDCWYVPQSRVMHIAGQSTGVTVRDQRPKRIPQYWFDSRRRYFLKNHGWLYAAIADLCWIVGFGCWRLRRQIQRKPDYDPPELLGDSIRNSVFFKLDRV
ncbi:MAG TPA: glycosyltransferase family 2 protein [Thermosynechococcaceae cyanobacterium]